MEYRIGCCDKCGREISKDYPARNLIDVDSTDNGVYCLLGGCFAEVSCNLMNERFVQYYNGKPIYYKDDMFFPYWRSFYYYDSLEECKENIDKISGSA